MDLDLSVPSFTQISRRAQTLHKRIKRLVKGKKKCHIIFDSTGLEAGSIGTQESESICKCLVINKMNKLGMPKGKPKGKWVLKVA